MRTALQSLFPSLNGTACSARVEFYNRFQRPVEDYECDCIKKHGEDLDTTLISVSVSQSPAFSCLSRIPGEIGQSFSAVTSAFIINIQSKLEELSRALLGIVVNAALGNTHSGADAAFPQ